MEHQKLLNILNETSDSRIIARKQNIFNDQLSINYDVRNEIILNTEVIKSNLCDYNDAYILVRSDITIIRCSIATEVAFNNCAPFINCITLIDGAAIDDAENLDLVMPIYGLIECSSNYSDVTGSPWFYSKGEVTDFTNNIVNNKSIELNYQKRQLPMVIIEFQEIQQSLYH